MVTYLIWFAVAAVLLPVLLACVAFFRSGEVRERPESMSDIVNRIERQSHLENVSYHERQEARAQHLVRIHGYRRGSEEAELLEDVVWNRVKYADAIQKVMLLRLRK